MVRGRRVKTTAMVGFSEAKDCLPRLKNRTYKKLVTSAYAEEHCITQYFKVDCYKSATEDHNNIIKCQEEEEDDSGPDLFVPPPLPATPHRIQLRPEQSKLEKRRNHETKKTAKIKPGTDHKLTEYFPVRRSVRKTKQAVLEEKQKNLRELLRNATEDGLEVRCFENKGRGVVAVKSFSRGDYVVEYSGELLGMSEAKKREAFYAQDNNTGCYMYYFKYQDQQYCIDATAETGRLGRLVNHSRNGNLITRAVDVDGVPRLVLIAKEHVNAGDEITYDYGDRSKEALKHHPWLAS